MSIKLVIFDLDGVLIDSKDIWYLAWKDSFKSVGINLSYDDFIENCWGSSFPICCKERGITGERYEKAGDTIKKSFISIVDRARVFDGVTNLLSDLKKRGIKTALLSNNSRIVLDKILAKLNFQFDAAPHLYENGLKPKPDPGGMYAILEKLGVNREEAIYIGDTKIDQEAGNIAGVRTLIMGKDIETVTDILKLI
jgi:HAD superfamily hydrolase (TIGR01549 family)